VKHEKELQLITKFLQYLSKPRGIEKQWKTVGALMILCGVAVATLLIVELVTMSRFWSAGILATVYFSGIVTGLGCMFLASAQQWTLLLRFLDRAGLEARKDQLVEQISEKK
jgi:hypothetical protein